MNRRSFPDGFVWGTATAAHQVEGGNWNNDWWAWEHTPGSGCAEPSGDACDHWHRWPQDLRLLADLGFSSYRFSLEWSRIEPEEGEWSRVALDRRDQGSHRRAGRPDPGHGRRPGGGRRGAGAGRPPGRLGGPVSGRGHRRRLHRGPDLHPAPVRAPGPARPRARGAPDRHGLRALAGGAGGDHPPGRRRHRRPVLVTENGIATDDDTQRIAFVRRALDSLLDCVAEGVDVRGYTYWSLLDNFEWAHGYRPRFGLVAVDRATQARTPKPSAAWLGQVARANALA